MEKIVGKIISDSTQKSYSVKWDSIENSAWIERKPELWEQVCRSIYSEQHALDCAKKFINGQKEMY